MISRNTYINELLRYKDKQIIKVITGIRRCGKSTLLMIYKQRLIDSGINNDNIISINFEDLALNKLLNPIELYKYIMENTDPNHKYYVFLDEIQNVTDFPKVVDSLFIQKNIDLYVTGSNAFMLSSELATLLSGRYIEISMQPLSLYEFVSYYSTEENYDLLYQRYIEESSFPFAIEFNRDQKSINEYLKGIYNTVLMKDVVTRHKIANPIVLESIANYMFENIGNMVSTNKISDTLTSYGRKTDVKTVEKYVNALCESFILYKVNRYDVKGKQHLKTLEKYYIVDLGLRYHLLSKKNSDIGRVLENVVYLELKRRGYEIYIGKLNDVEIDFVAMNENGIAYFQVAASIRNKDTFERELRPLQSLGDSYPKIILTLDRDPSSDYDGIKTMNAIDWLMNVNM